MLGGPWPGSPGREGGNRIWAASPKARPPAVLALFPDHRFRVLPGGSPRSRLPRGWPPHDGPHQGHSTRSRCGAIKERSPSSGLARASREKGQKGTSAPTSERSPGHRGTRRPSGRRLLQRASEPSTPPTSPGTVASPRPRRPAHLAGLRAPRRPPPSLAQARVRRARHGAGRLRGWEYTGAWIPPVEKARPPPPRVSYVAPTSGHDGFMSPYCDQRFFPFLFPKSFPSLRCKFFKLRFLRYSLQNNTISKKDTA